jgi:Tol biopolymer transport system component
VRQLVLSAIVVVACAAILWGQPSAQPATSPLLTYVTTAHQLGVVGYRDPIGAISPDGKHFAYSEGRFVRVIPIGGGAPLTIAPGEGQIRSLVWTSNSHIAVEDITPAGRWWLHEIESGKRVGRFGASDVNNDQRQLTCANDRGCTALRFTSSGAELFPVGSDVVSFNRVSGRPSWPAVRPNGSVACIVNARITLSCGGDPLKLNVDLDVYGPIAFSPDGNTVYFSSPNAAGMVDLWSADVTTRRAQRVSNFSRDAYAPSVSADGTVVFKVQSYRTHLADVALEGGVTRQLTTFQSETPSYHPTSPFIAFTYGTWRRVIDDAKYPDIAQDIGVITHTIDMPADQPHRVIAQSDSEDQAMAWSPNGKWIAFHTHREMSDDVWLRPADGSQPDKRITFLGRGAETGWPRWSLDGTRVLLEGARKSDGRHAIYTIGVDQNTGNLTSELREVNTAGFNGLISHAEWLGNNTIVAITKEGPGRHAIISVPAAGGETRIVHRFASEHDFPGLGVSPDGREVAFVAPAPDGYFQIFRKGIAGDAAPRQVTTDPSHKTQPTWSPDGQRIAFTVWSYDATFFSFRER